MTRALVLAYHYPPLGGAAVQRNRLVDRLPALGVDPVVITGTGRSDGRWAPADPSLGDGAGARIEVLRPEGPEPASSSGRRRQVEGLLDLRSPLARWWESRAVSLARAAGPADLLFATLVPYESAAPAVRISRELGIPWVADLQDPWALDEMWIYPTDLHRRRDLRRMGEVLSTAAMVIMNTPEAARRVRAAFPHLDPDRVVAITNGYDAPDFEGPLPARDDDSLRIVHTGTMHTELALRHRGLRRLLGGRAYEVDILPRSHVHLLAALDRLRTRDPAAADSVEVHLAGPLTAGDRRVAEQSSARVVLRGYLPHGETVSLIRSADLLFLPMHDMPRGERAGLVPGKAYEYMASGRPILAAVPDGDARDFLEACGTAQLVRPSDEAAMEHAVAAALARRERGEPPPQQRREAVERFERGRLAEQLAAVFDAALGRAPSPATATG